jgi:hypothetical protein
VAKAGGHLLCRDRLLDTGDGLLVPALTGLAALAGNGEAQAAAGRGGD